MIICICHHVTEKQIKDLLPLPLEEVMLRTDAGMCCGQCMTMLQQVVEPECPGTLNGNASELKPR